jgi:hypothetical protein
VFANTAGILDLVGSVRIGGAELKVEWVASGGGNTTGALGSWTVHPSAGGGLINSPGHPDITVRPGETTNGRIEFEFSFTGDGQVALQAVASNTGTLPAYIADPTGGVAGSAWWSWDVVPGYTHILGGRTPAEWGIEVDVF